MNNKNGKNFENGLFSTIYLRKNKYYSELLLTREGKLYNWYKKYIYI